MKPINWDDMTSEMQERHARKLIDSERGHLVIALALYLGSKELRKTQPGFSEDMELIGETIYRAHWEHWRKIK